MKKAKAMLLIALTSVLILSGCGNGQTSEVIHPDDLGEPIVTVSPNTDEVTTAEDSSPEYTDVAPAEGMVKSTLTSLWVEEEVYNSRPIAVMFPTDKGSQPQYGIGLAGILYECMEEGGISRQMGIIEDWQDLSQIGNIRSGRDYYAYWCMEWDAFFVHWGGPFYLVDIVNRSDFNNLSACTVGVTEKLAPAVGSEAFYRSDPKNPTIHNGYTNGSKLSSAIKSLGYKTEHRDNYFEPEHFKFASFAEPNSLDDASGSFDATSIDLSKIFPVTYSSLTYNEEEGVYYKFLYNNKQIDELTGEQLTFTNVIVQNTYWEYRPDNKYIAFQCIDSTRDGYYFTGGKGIHITWKKTSDTSPTRYYDDKGNEIKLNPGKTFIAIAQDGKEVIYK